jgi:uncharacterized protein (DUF1015 family)
MAEIKPLKAWRYNPNLVQDIETLTSPLFDVVSEKQRQALYKNPFNSIHLSVPAEPNAAEAAAERLIAWKQNQVLLQDQLPGIYVYYQYFNLPGSKKEFCRKGFICNIRAYQWDEGVILRHENTIPQSVNDRIDLLAASLLNVSPTHGLYTDPGFELEAYMDECITNPLYETEDYQGVRDVLGVIHDAGVIRKFMEVLSSRQVILADGHHRYEGSIVYRQRMQEANPNHTGDEAYNFHLMYLTNTESDDLRILPTHRVVIGLPDFQEDELLAKLSEYFHIRTVDDPHDINEIIVGKKWAFGLILKDQSFKIRLKEEVFPLLQWNFPLEVKTLDLTVLHYFVMERIFGIKGKEQRSSEHIRFERNFADCLRMVENGKAQCAFITQEISMEEVKQVCYSGFTMPQKSTYFYPKVICGFLFGSIKEDEFKVPTYFSV